MCVICSVAQHIQKHRKNINSLPTTEQLTHTVLLNSSASKRKKLSSYGYVRLAASLEHHKKP